EKEGQFVPAMNVEEGDNNIRVTAELPGLSEGDVEISLEGGVLTISGEKKLEKKESKEGEFRYYESSYGKFMRQLTINKDVDEDKIDATFKNGMLNITL